jgi:acetyltransferase
VGKAPDVPAGYPEVVQYQSEFDDHLTLPNNSRLRTRRLRRCEDRVIRELYRHLSSRTRYLRFSLAMPELPDSLLAILTCVDEHRRLALLAESDTDAGPEVVALSEFVAIDHHTAEVGLVVRDDWQRQGLGTVLAARTLLVAEARGFDRFRAQVHYDNVGVMRLLDRVAVITSMTHRPGVCEITFVRRGHTLPVPADTCGTSSESDT